MCSSPAWFRSADAMINATGTPRRDLSALVGEWTVEISFPTDPPGTVQGHASFDWLEDGALLIMRSGSKHEGPPYSISVIGRDDADTTYTMLYTDDRGVSRMYQMSLDGGEWKQWRDAPGFSQRFSGTFSEDGSRIIARWEKSLDGTHWEHDFDLQYSKIS